MRARVLEALLSSLCDFASSLRGDRFLRDDAQSSRRFCELYLAGAPLSRGDAQQPLEFARRVSRGRLGHSRCAHRETPGCWGACIVNAVGMSFSQERGALVLWPFRYFFCVWSFPCSSKKVLLTEFLGLLGLGLMACSKIMANRAFREPQRAGFPSVDSGSVAKEVW